MGKFLSVFVLSVLVSAIFFFIFGNVFDGGDPPETAIYTFGTIIVILLSFVISLIYYLIDVIKKMN